MYGFLFQSGSKGREGERERERESEREGRGEWLGQGIDRMELIKHYSHAFPHLANPVLDGGEIRPLFGGFGPAVLDAGAKIIRTARFRLEHHLITSRRATTSKRGLSASRIGRLRNDLPWPSWTRPPKPPKAISSLVGHCATLESAANRLEGRLMADITHSSHSAGWRKKNDYGRRCLFHHLRAACSARFL